MTSFKILERCSTQPFGKTYSTEFGSETISPLAHDLDVVERLVARTTKSALVEGTGIFWHRSASMHPPPPRVVADTTRRISFALLLLPIAPSLMYRV